MSLNDVGENHQTYQSENTWCHDWKIDVPFFRMFGSSEHTGGIAG